MKTNLFAGVAVAVLAVGSLSYWAGTRSIAPAPSPAASGAPAKAQGGPPAGIAVEAQRPTPTRLPQSLTTVGSLRSEETVCRSRITLLSLGMCEYYPNLGVDPLDILPRAADVFGSPVQC